MKKSRNQAFSMIKLSRLRQRAISIVTAVTLVIAGIAPVVINGSASAAAVQVTARSIQLSSSAISATAVTYKVKWTQPSSAVSSVVIDFCDSASGPIVGNATCVVPTGLSVGTPTFTLVSGLTGAWTAASTNSGRTFTLTRNTGSDTFTTAEFDITSMTNPSVLGTFYGRIIAYPNASGADSAATYTPGTEGTNYNYGGTALSTVNQLVITAKVQESLTFCIYVTGANCAGASGSSIALGDTNGVLANAATVYTSTANFGLASNAQTGVTVRMKGDVLTAGSNTISAYGAGTSAVCVADSAVTSVEQFGMRVSAPGTGVTAATTPAEYNCAAASHNFYTSGTDGTTSTYGGVIATTAGATDESQTTMEFAAKAATATEAGIYTSTLTFIATGVY